MPQIGTHGDRVRKEPTKCGSTVPLPAAYRRPALAVLRGFTLVGSVIMNTPGFSFSDWHASGGSRYGPGAAD